MGIRVTIEVIPQGDESRTRVLATAHVSLITSPMNEQFPTYGDYEVAFDTDGAKSTAYIEAVLRTQPIWPFLTEVLEKTVP